MSVLFDNCSIRCILQARRRDCVLTMELRSRLCLKSISVQLVQRRLRWFGRAERHDKGEPIKDPYCATISFVSKAKWRPTEDVGNCTSGSLGASSEPQVFGCARWRKGWMKHFQTQDHQALGASFQNVGNSIGDPDLTRPQSVFFGKGGFTHPYVDIGTLRPYWYV